MTEAQESMPATANSAAVKTVLIWGGVLSLVVTARFMANDEPTRRHGL